MTSNHLSSDFSYKKYSLEQLDNWVNDALSCEDLTPQDIYNTIVKCVDDSVEYHKKNLTKSVELLSLLKGHRPVDFETTQSDWNDFWEENYYPEEVKVDDGMRPWGHSDLEYMIHNKEPLSCDKDDPSPECKKSWTKFWEETPYPLYVSEDGDVWAPDYVTKEDKVKRWVLPTQVDGLTGDVIVNLPDDLLEGAGLKEGDVIEWIDRKDGSFEMRKVNGTK